MTSVLTHYAQRDNRVEIVTITGNITNNGSTAGTPAQQNPAYAAIDLTKSKNFSIDTRILRLRTDSPGSYLLRVYITSNKPPSYYPNFEFDLLITPPENDELILIEIYANKAAAEIGTGKLYSVTNEIPPSSGDYSDTTGVVSFKVFNNSIILKALSPNFSF